MTILKEQIGVVASWRKSVATLQERKDSLWLAFQQENKEIFDALDSAKAECGAAEQILRELTLQAYQETGNKTPAPGVGIRIVSRLIYDAGRAFEWAKAHGLALKLDASAFEKIAKADKPDFVEVQTEPQATIATDLSKVI